MGPKLPKLTATLLTLIDVTKFISKVFKWFLNTSYLLLLTNEYIFWPYRIFFLYEIQSDNEVHIKPISYTVNHLMCRPI